MCKIDDCSKMGSTGLIDNACKACNDAAPFAITAGTSCVA